MGLARLVTRRKGASVVPVVVLGAALSLGVVALTASRFGWRRTKAETRTSGEANEEERDEQARESRWCFKPAPPRAADAPRWDTPPAGVGGTRPDPPAP